MKCSCGAKMRFTGERFIDPNDFNVYAAMTCDNSLLGCESKYVDLAELQDAMAILGIESKVSIYQQDKDKMVSKAVVSVEQLPSFSH